MTEPFTNLDFVFVGITLVTVAWFHLAVRSTRLLIVLLVWLLIQSVLGWAGFFENTESLPPRIMAFGILPNLIAMIVAFRTKKGRDLIDRINLKTLTWMHTIRIPVEITLTLLYHAGLVSVLMTWEGTNWDILSGLSAPVIALIAFGGGEVKKKLLLIWNVIALVLLLNVVITAALAFPSPIQQLAFDQPNLAILSFPYNLLPAVVVPIVMFGHFVAIRRLRKG